MDVVIRRNVIKPSEFSVVFLSRRFHGRQIVDHAHSWTGYATRDEAVMALERIPTAKQA